MKAAPDNVAQEFRTPSGKLEIYSAQLEAMSVPPLRIWEADPEEVADAARCLARIWTRDRWIVRADKQPIERRVRQRQQRFTTQTWTRLRVQQSAPGRKAACQARPTVVITRSDSMAPSAAPFSKSPSIRAIWLVTWAKQITGFCRAVANA